nr:MAG: RNA-dependent RNA polymerase [Fusariviridae sp.]
MVVNKFYRSFSALHSIEWLGSNSVGISYLKICTCICLFSLGFSFSVLLAFAPFVLTAFLLSPFITGGILFNSGFLFFFPLVIAALSAQWRAAVVTEKMILDKFGPKGALWMDQDTTVLGSGFRPVVIGGCDTLVPKAHGWLLDKFPTLAELLGEETLNAQDIASITWSGFIEILSIITLGPNIASVMACIVLIRRAAFLHLLSAKLAIRILKWTFISIIAVMLADGRLFVMALKFLVQMLALSQEQIFLTWLRWRLTHFAVAITVMAVDVMAVGRKYTPVAYSQLGGKQHHRSFVGLAKEKLMQATIFMSDLGLPHYIRGTRQPSKQGLQESLDILSNLGWPVNVSLNEEVGFETAKQGFQEWLVCGTDWHQGIHNLKTWTDELLDGLRVNAVEFRRTEEYANEANELEATSRYFRSPRYDYPDLALDDVWYLVKDTYQYSRLTPFNHIIRMWEKKYGLGAFFRKPGKRGKLSRRDFIKSIGGLGPFKDLWRRTFEFATVVVPVAAVSVKGEALPPKKWMNDKVRSIIGSPLVHYIMSTIWNYEPNHRFAWTTTPTKIGMPLNGYWLADVYHRHSRCQHHFAGDMSAFDSTISGKVVDLIKAIRKKGYEEHRDHARICNLIDVAYDQLGHQLLNTTSTGQVYRKGTGLTTGHSSTSADNSLALAILYLFAWKELTGLGAREFVHFNELSDYGDDHVLSFLSTKPAAWNFKNIQKAMARWGVTNRLEASGPLSSIPFLSKFSRKVTIADRQMFDKYQVPVPKRVVWHDKDRLLGKMVARIKNPDPRYRAKRLMSYLSLTAHHEDLYLGIKKVLTRSSTMKRAMRQMGVQVPTYQKILADWYHPTTHTVHDEFGEEAEETQTDGKVFSYGNVGWFDSALGALSLVPDFVNPAIFNFGYDRLFQLQVRPWLSWAYLFVVSANSIASEAEARRAFGSSVYSCLAVDVFAETPLAESHSHFLVRHWLFLAYHSFIRAARPTPWLAGLSKKIAQWQFALNGKIFAEFAVLDWKLLDLLVICLLNLVPTMPWLEPIGLVTLPRFDIAWQTLTGWFVGLFWTSVPPNYKDLTHHLRKLSALKGPLLVEAPTGTGKSTAMIKHISLTVGARYNKVLVVQPRSQLVKGLVPYVRDSLMLDCTGLTSGSDYDPTRKVIYLTAQEFLIHKLEFLDSANLVIVDEAHIAEPAYQVVQMLLGQKEDIDCIFTTATPTPLNVELSGAYVPLVTASVWKVDQLRQVSHAKSIPVYLAGYRSWVKELIEGMPRTSKALVFYPSIDGGKRLANTLSRKSTFLNSSEVDFSGQVIISTSVADAGITIPDVDLVITPCIDFFQDGMKARPVYGKLSGAQVLQRKGRTGRTNNGRFQLYDCEGLDIPQGQQLLEKPGSVVGTLLSTGMTVHTIKDLVPDIYDGFLRENQHRPGTATADAFTDSVGKAIDNMKWWLQARNLEDARNAGLDVAEVIFDYTAAGQTSESSFVSVSQALQDVVDLFSDLATSNDPQSALESHAEGPVARLAKMSGLQVPWTGFFDWTIAQELDPELAEGEHKMQVANKDKL